MRMGRPGRFRCARPAAVLLAVLLALGLSGCHGKKNSAAFAVPEAFDETGKYTLTFWAKNDTNRTQTKIYEQAIADFEALYPNISVDLRLYTDYGKIYNDVITNIATDTTPNVCITYPDHIATYMTGENVVVPLDDLFVSEKYGLGGSELRFDAPSREEIVPEFLDECILRGFHYAVPYMRSTEACYINKTYVEALGYELPDVLTWDFVWEVSEAALEKNADGTFALNGQKIMIPFIYKSTDNMMIQMLRQKGADYSTDAGEIGIFNDTTKELLYTVADHVKSGAFSTFKISSYPANFLNAGQCLFAVDSTAGATWMGSEAPLSDISEDKIVRFETAVRPVPQFDAEHPQMISQGPSVCIFNKTDPQEVLASWLFTEFLLTNEVQIAYSETEGYIPVTRKAQEDPEYQNYLAARGEDNKVHYEVKIDAAQMLIANTENTFTTPVFNGSASLRDAAGQLIENTARSVRRKEKINDAYMTKLFANVQSLYHLDQIAARSGPAEGRENLGPMPMGSRMLLAALVLTWCCIGLYVLLERLKRKQAK